MKITARRKERSRNLPSKEDNQEGHSHHHLPLEARPTVEEEVLQIVKHLRSSQDHSLFMTRMRTKTNSTDTEESKDLFIILIKLSKTARSLQVYRRRIEATRKQGRSKKSPSKINREHPNIACSHAHVPCKDPEQCNISDDLKNI